MPDYFTGLFKQLANITTSQQAEVYIKQISDSLELTLTQDESKLFFTYAPSYIKSPKSRFYSSLFDWSKSYRHLSLLERIKVMQGLTDDKEAETRVAAYLKAVVIVSSSKNQDNILHILPSQLSKLV